MNIFKTRKTKKIDNIFTLIFLFIYFVLIYIDKKYDPPTIVILIIVFVPLVSIFVRKLIRGIYNENLKFDIKIINDQVFALFLKNKMIEILYDDFKMTNIKKYRDEIKLYTKENIIRIKMQKNNIDNLKMIIDKLGDENIQRYFEENIKGIRFKDIE